MKKAAFLFVAAILAAASAAHAFDRNALAVHLRKTLSLDTRTPIQVNGDPAPSGIGNLLVVHVTVGGAPYPVYFTPDQKKYIWGFVADFTVDPDKEHMALLNPKSGHAQGSATAPVTVVEFSDLQCSHCKVAHDEISKNLYKAYKPDQVRFVFKHFPLTGHDWAESAAVASECAADQKEAAFWTVTDYFFANQEQVTKENVKAKSLEIAKSAGLNLGTFEKCLASPAVLERVRDSKKEGLALGVGSTPTIFINGRQRRGFRDFDDIKVVVDEKLGAKK
jgi:protein-disulfide isomerase